MAQLTLSHTLVPNTPENINDVQDNFDDITAHLNTALVGADNLTSPNYSVARVLFEVAGSFVTEERRHQLGSWARPSAPFRLASGSSIRYQFGIRLALRWRSRAKLLRCACGLT